MEVKKAHKAEKGSDLSHIKEFKSLTAVLQKQRQAEEKANHRLEHLYGKDHPENLKYNAEEAESRKRESKKHKLRILLDKYVK